jgi:hypothetical protein
VLTNKKGLPETFVTALDRDYHKSADYSASQLLKPARMVHLENRHSSEIVEDVTDKIWALFGSAVHGVLQNGETDNQLVEQYMKSEIDGVTLSGMADLYEDGIIYDYKVTSVWSYIYMEDKLQEWESQLNTYAYLFSKYGFELKGLKIVMILRDWQASKAKFDSNYPDCQVQIVPVNLWPAKKTLQHLKDRIKVYEDTKLLQDNELPECSFKERWGKPPKFAVMKNGRKSAVKVSDSKTAALSLIEAKGNDHYLEIRTGEQWKRCEYCRVSAFCNQYQDRDND